MSKYKVPGTQYEADYERGPGVWPLNHLSSEKDREQYAGDRQKVRDKEESDKETKLKGEVAQYPKTAKQTVAPTIEPPKRSKEYYDRIPKVLPKYISADEDPKSRKHEVPAEFRVVPKTHNKQKGDDDDLSFGQAFSRHRKSGAKEFNGRGTKYTTKVNEGIADFGYKLGQKLYDVTHPKGNTAQEKLTSVANPSKDSTAGKIINRKDAIKRQEEILKNEEVNVVSGGNIAGLGVGPEGEPGLPKKRKPRIADLVTFMKR